MTELKDCLPDSVRKHFINLRNVRQEAAVESESLLALARTS